MPNTNRRKVVQSEPNSRRPGVCNTDFMTDIPDIKIDQLIDQYDVLLFDSYGVLAGSTGTFPGAVDLVNHLNDIQKPYFILTNDASALPETRSQKYAVFGLIVKADQIITSGSLLKSHFKAMGLNGTRCVVLGTEDSARYTEQAGGTVVGLNDHFDTIVIGDQSGFPFVEAVDAVMTSLFHRLDKGEHTNLIMPNPDLIYPEGDGFGMASASVGLIFEAALNLRYPERPELTFTRLGKPHPAIYEEAFSRSGTMKMAMIGDQLETDIKGAIDFGIDSVLVNTGITNADARNIPDALRPTYRMHSLKPGT